MWCDDLPLHDNFIIESFLFPLFVSTIIWDVAFAPILPHKIFQNLCWSWGIFWNAIWQSIHGVSQFSMHQSTWKICCKWFLLLFLDYSFFYCNELIYNVSQPLRVTHLSPPHPPWWLAWSHPLSRVCRVPTLQIAYLPFMFFLIFLSHLDGLKGQKLEEVSNIILSQPPRTQPKSLVLQT